jgi:branched-subunit amino acid aminotransferase/4-amino-4-deoxychorismate lyase
MEIIPVIEKRLSLAEFHTADEVFTTGDFLFSTYTLYNQMKNLICTLNFKFVNFLLYKGSMGEITKVICIDGRNIGDGSYKGEITSKIRIAFRKLTDTIGVPLP